MPTKVPSVAAVTIGQSPRPDIVGDMAGLVPDVRWVEAGALDGLDESSLDALAPWPGDVPLVTRAAGHAVVVGEHRILSRVQAALDTVVTGADAAVILCSGDLPSLFAPVPVLLPGVLLDRVTASLASGRRLNVFVPHEGQVERQRRRWHERRVPARVWVVHPDDATDFEAAGRRAGGTGDLTMLDCVGYSTAQQARVRRGAGHAVLSARGIAARVLADMLGQ